VAIPPTNGVSPGISLLGLAFYATLMGLSYFARTRDNLQEERAAAAEADTIATRARLTALQAQFKPHFLFNALHSLSALVRHDPAAAEELLERLGESMRYLVDEGARDRVPLGAELRFVEDFLAIERVRYGDRLDVRMQIQPDALAFRVPPFCLQPLVENAIKHGIAPKSGGGTLLIDVGLQGDRLILRVSDDGVGADPGGLDGSKGFGLQALGARLKALGGNLTFDTGIGRGFSATVRI
jgi:LytS/YehU family sensor histidine kinase